MSDGALTTGAAPDAGSRLAGLAAGVTVGLLVCRLLTIGRFGLYFDEAYYWLWSLHLQGSYYDHPPMVALFIRAGTLLFGETEFGVRFFSSVSMAVSAVLVFAITNKLSDNRRAAAWAVLLFNATTLMTFSVFVVPDEALLMFWLAALYGMAVIAKGGDRRWWLFVGVMLGAAGAAKLTTLFLAAPIPLWLALAPSLRRWLRSAWPYLGAGIAVLVLVPTIAWNAGNDWATLATQYHRETFGALRADGFVRYLALFPIVATPSVLILGLIGYFGLLRDRWRHDPAKALLVLTPIPLTLYFAVYSLTARIGEHWFSPVVVMLAIFGGIAVRAPVGGWVGVIVTWSRRLAIPVALLFAAAFYLPVILSPLLTMPRGLDFMARFRGWPDYAAAVETLRTASGADYVLGRDYWDPAYLRFYGAADMPAFQLGEFDRWSHFCCGLSGLPLELSAATGLYVGSGSVAAETDFLADYFNSVLFVGTVAKPEREDHAVTARAFLVSDPLPAAMPLFGLTNPGSHLP